MKKENIENAKNSLPSLVANVANYLKSLVTLEKQKDTITNASGTIGFFISLFGKPIIDQYYQKKKDSKFENNGFNTYVIAAFKQVQTSLRNLSAKLEEMDVDLPIVALGIEKYFSESLEVVGRKKYPPIFQPKYHPVIVMIKEVISKTLLNLQFAEKNINSFLKDFNQSIENAVEEEFGEDYEDFKKLLNRTWFVENEAQLLIDQINLSTIGFTEKDNLKYEDAFARWAPIFQNISLGRENEETAEQNSEIEKSLVKVEELIDEYFNINPENHLEKVLFILADFGKGKSVFLRQYASKLANIYIESGEGYFPIYFNLRDFSSFSSDTPLGIIEDFLQTKYAIQIRSDYFKGKKYLFLIDSLDESCDLSKSAIDNVINSIKRIQFLDKSQNRTNKLIITTRPIGENLLNHIQQNSPYIVKKENKEVSHYISLYGFKKEQFNDWIYDALRNILYEINLDTSRGFIFDLIEKLKTGEEIDLHSLLLENESLTISELRRPIFAYMIYQLLRNNINITQIGKIGIYLSFLNLLSKEAKYIHEPGIKISLQEQFEARNILHEIAALWAFERQQGKQGFLRKSDICRMIGNYGNTESDSEVIDKYHKDGGSDIHFLSHSYFGENNSLLHFQHQSFAEILLAEYYIKVLIKCALDRSRDIEFVIAKLKVGMPTGQTIGFLEEILTLLKETAVSTSDSATIEKRKLLVPLFASISISKNNKKLYSDHLFYQWYGRANVSIDANEIPESLILNWCLNQSILNKTIDLCEEIINSEKISTLSKIKTSTSLIDNEIAFIANHNYLESIFLEKYLALIAGNILQNTDSSFFIRKADAKVVLKLLQNSSPVWVRKHFRGVILKGDDNRFMSNLDLNRIDFSDAIFDNLYFKNCLFTMCRFKRTIFRNVVFRESSFIHCRTYGIVIENYIDITGLSLFAGRFIPPYIVRKVISESLKNRDNFDEISIYRHIRTMGLSLSSVTVHYIESVMKGFYFYFRYALQNGYISKEDIHKAFPNKSKKSEDRIDYYVNRMLNHTMETED